jgi:hypothetical protein
MKNRLFISLIAAGVLSVGVVSAFDDVTDDYEYLDAVEYLYENEIIEGYDDGTFKPSNDINRAEFLKVLILPSYGAEPPVSVYSNCFDDVGTQWYASYVCYAYSNGWVSGYGDGDFRPEQTVSNAEALKMIFEVYGVDIAEAEKDEDWYVPYENMAEVYGFLGDFTANVAMDRGKVSNLLYEALTIGGLGVEGEDGPIADEDEDEDDTEFEVSIVIEEDEEEVEEVEEVEEDIEAKIALLEDEWNYGYDDDSSDPTFDTVLICTEENYEVLAEIYDYFKDNPEEENTLPDEAQAFVDHEYGEIFYAAYSGCRDIVLDNLDVAGVGETVDGVHDLLYFAVIQNDAILADYLFDEGFYINELYEDGESLLHLYAVTEDYDYTADLENLIYEYSANVNTLNAEGLPAVWTAVSNEVYAYEYLEVLIGAGADLEVVDDEARTLLHEAAFSAGADVVELLIDSGLSVLSINDYGETPLHAAVAGGDEEVVQVLLDEGADPYEEDDDGFSAITLASYLGEFDILELLITQ